MDEGIGEVQWGERTWRLLAERAIDWRDVVFALRDSHPAMRRWVGPAVLQVTAMDRSNRWLTATLVEVVGEDDVFDIFDVRYLGDDESKAADKTQEES